MVVLTTYYIVTIVTFHPCWLSPTYRLNTERVNYSTSKVLFIRSKKPLPQKLLTFGHVFCTHICQGSAANPCPHKRSTSLEKHPAENRFTAGLFVCYLLECTANCTLPPRSIILEINRINQQRYQHCSMETGRVHIFKGVWKCLKINVTQAHNRHIMLIS